MPHLVVLVTPCVVLPHAHDEIEDSDKCPNGIWVASEHDVAESNVVVSGDMAGGNTREG